MFVESASLFEMRERTPQKKSASENQQLIVVRCGETACSSAAAAESFPTLRCETADAQSPASDLAEAGTNAFASRKRLAAATAASAHWPTVWLSRLFERAIGGAVRLVFFPLRCDPIVAEEPVDVRAPNPFGPTNLFVHVTQKKKIQNVLVSTRVPENHLPEQKIRPNNTMSIQRTLTNNGIPIAIVGNTVQTATPIRTAATTIVTSAGSGNSGSRDLWNAYAFNTSTDHVTLHVEIGSPHCTMSVLIPPKGTAATRVLTNLPLPRNTSIRAYATTGNVIYMYGFASSSVAAE